MAAITAFTWLVRRGLFARLNRGETIEDKIPASWRLMPGDILAWETENGEEGCARVVHVGIKQADETVVCTFQKVS